MVDTKITGMHRYVRMLEAASGKRPGVKAARAHGSATVKPKTPSVDAHASLLSSITDLRQRCPALQSLQDEYTVISTLEVYLSQGLVSEHTHHVTCTGAPHIHAHIHTHTQTLYSHVLMRTAWSTISAHLHAQPQ